ncbi:MAG: hypothetical protein R3B13_15280 [Polyangiaceae bacterium]
MAWRRSKYLRAVEMGLAWTSARRAFQRELSRVQDRLHQRRRDFRAVQMSAAAVAGAVTLPEDDATLCVDLIFNALSRRARREVEKIIMVQYEPSSEFLRRLKENASKAGREEATVLATANAILRVLEARDLRVSRAVERRIRKCADLPTLELWVSRAATVERATKLFD